MIAAHDGHAAAWAVKKALSEGAGHIAVMKLLRSPGAQAPLLVTVYWVKVGSQMARVELYKAYRIRAYERQLSGRWLAEIRKADGSAVVILDGGTRREFITTSAAMFSSEAAIKLARQAIDGGGLK
jgi:hypothetical protein